MRDELGVHVGRAVEARDCRDLAGLDGREAGPDARRERARRELPGARRHGVERAGGAAAGPGGVAIATVCGAREEAVAVVTAERLVAAVAREADRHRTARELRHEERRYLRLVGERLVVDRRQ